MDLSTDYANFHGVAAPQYFYSFLLILSKKKSKNTEGVFFVPKSIRLQPPCNTQSRHICHQDFMWQFATFKKHAFSVLGRYGL
jgi:hypothetical protein